MTKEDFENLRREIKVIADKIDQLRRSPQMSILPEVAANVVLAYRHLEDASMRLGKAIQAGDGGISVYDRTQVPAA